MSLSTISDHKKDWASLVDSNTKVLNKLPVDGAVHLGAVATYLNGAKGDSDCWYLPVPGGKVVFLELKAISEPKANIRKAMCQVPSNIAPSHTVGAIVNENSYTTNTGDLGNSSNLNTFMFWSSLEQDQNSMFVTLCYLHFD